MAKKLHELRTVTTPEGPHLFGRVTVPFSEQHAGIHTMEVCLRWLCPQCDRPRGILFNGISFDGSLRLAVSQWVNACSHIDTYEAVRAEGLAFAGTEAGREIIANWDTYPDATITTDAVSDAPALLDDLAEPLSEPMPEQTALALDAKIRAALVDVRADGQYLRARVAGCANQDGQDMEGYIAKAPTALENILFLDALFGDDYEQGAQLLLRRLAASYNFCADAPIDDLEATVAIGESLKLDEATGPNFDARAVGATVGVCYEIISERGRQNAKWGEQDHALVCLMPPQAYAVPFASAARAVCDKRHRKGIGSWGDILIEEVAEVMEAAAQGNEDYADSENHLAHLGVCPRRFRGDRRLAGAPARANGTRA